MEVYIVEEASPFWIGWFSRPGVDVKSILIDGEIYLSCFDRNAKYDRTVYYMRYDFNTICLDNC
jgi:hypothetical protein